MKRLFRKDYVYYTFLIVFAGLLFTVFILESDSTLWKGAITAKYFWFASVMCLVPFLIFFQRFMKYDLHITDIIFLFFFGYVVINWFSRNGHPDMRWWLTLLMLPLYAAVRIVSGNEKFRRWFSFVLLAVVLTEAVWGLLQLYNVTYSYHNLYKITGSFFNPGPYSGFVAVGVPLALAFTLDKSLTRWERYLGFITLAVAALALPATMSRAAWIAAVAGCLPILWKTFQVSDLKLQIRNTKFVQYITSHFSLITIRIFMVFTIGFFVFFLFSRIYLMKKDSADGRWLIWKVSMEAIKQWPLFGAGYGQFSAVYGDAQIYYFLTDKGNEAQIMAADSPDYAFNEYVQVTVELGVIGLLLFLLLTGSTLVYRHSYFSPFHASFITFLVFALFSYPFSVLPLGIIFIFFLALSAPSSKKISPNMPLWFHIVSMSVFCVFIAYGTCQILSKKKMYREWTMAQTMYHAKAYQQIISKYSSLYPYLQHEKHFLFEYGLCLSNTNQYTESNRILEEFLWYGSDPMIYNCIGNNFKAMGEYSQAESMYIRSSQTVPNRHYPLYLLMNLYIESGQAEKAKDMAVVLLEKPVKIPSTAIREMHEKAKGILDSD